MISMSKIDSGMSARCRAAEDIVPGALEIVCATVLLMRHILSFLNTATNN
jgi:hypothetical protein